MRTTERGLRCFSHKERTMRLDLPKPIAAYFTAERERWAPIIKASGARME